MKKWEVWMNGYSDGQQFYGDALPKMIGTVKADSYDAACESVAAKYNKKMPDEHKLVREDAFDGAGNPWWHSNWSIWGIRVLCAEVN